jgi:hypothetical protein
MSLEQEIKEIKEIKEKTDKKYDDLLTKYHNSLEDIKLLEEKIDDLCRED